MKLLITFFIMFAGIHLQAKNSIMDFKVVSYENIVLETPYVFDWEKTPTPTKNVAIVTLKGPAEPLKTTQSFETLFMFDDRVGQNFVHLDKNTVRLIVPKHLTDETLISLGPQALPEELNQKRRTLHFKDVQKNSKKALSLEFFKRDKFKSPHLKTKKSPTVLSGPEQLHKRAAQKI